PRLPAARPAAHPSRDALARPADRARERGALRVHGQRPRPGGTEHVVPRVRRAPDRTRLVRAGDVGPRRVRLLLGVRGAGPGRLRGAPGHLGVAAPAGAPRGVSAHVRPAAVAGLFYPAEPGELAAEVDALLAAAPTDGAPG